MSAAPNALVLKTQIYPLGRQIKIQDCNTTEIPQDAGRAQTPINIGKHILCIYTMSADDADYLNARVIVRVLHGRRRRGLGDEIYAGPITLTEPVLAIADVLDDPQQAIRLPLKEFGTIAVKIFTRTTIADISGPNQINILLEPEVLP